MTALLPGVPPPPAGPASQRWGLGIGDALAAVSRLPDPLQGVLRLLNHFGGLAVSADDVEFDGDSVDWSDVVDIETHSLVGYLLTDALQAQVNRLPVPRFPFRRRVLGLASDAVLTAAVAAAGRPLSSLLDVRVPTEVNYRGRLRHRTLSAGVLATILLAHPAVRAAVVDTASAHGVPVRRADDDAIDAAERRARWIENWLRDRF
ncbi:hypothetical protein FK535_04230 [Mycolicibacterium sp. 018/SC-01/001]|uniref:hypothetical protein n=1 Tax=Mycolicibacterium sp. 018/SC-01/001 TaxID=2592069 RepID=UPI00117D460A|nr:hypothetical protein [Mycolicibacterium sp. 018/SC-01/001]TRW88407.1 hypothetical protein FK535_04230 [Mycolicibacterium sp. 018/SC-01/001]